MKKFHKQEYKKKINNFNALHIEPLTVTERIFSIEQKYRWLLKYMIWPVLISTLLYFYANQVNGIEQIKSEFIYLGALLDFLKEIFNYLILFVKQFIIPIVSITVVVGILYFQNKEYDTSVSKIIWDITKVLIIFIFLVLFVVLILVYFITFSEETATAIPLYYPIVVIGYDCFKWIVSTLFRKR